MMQNAQNNSTTNQHESRSTPVVRRGRSEEFPLAYEIATLAWEPIFEHRRKVMGDQMYEDLFGNWRENKVSEIRNSLEKHPEHFLVVEVDGQIKGFATFWVEAEKSMGIVGNNAVHPEAQGQGLGKLLHESILDEFRQRDLKYAQVLTGLDPAHTPARNSYIKNGFKLSIEYGIYHQEL